MVTVVTPGGVELVGDLYRPAIDPPYPAIFQISSGGARGLRRVAEAYAGRGYLFAAFDARGRYRSQGEWDPFVTAAEDVRALVRWLAERPECSGRIAGRGHGWDGTGLLLAAADPPAEFAAISVGFPFESPFRGGALDIGAVIAALANDDAESDVDSRRFGTWEEEGELSREEWTIWDRLRTLRAEMPPPKPSIDLHDALTRRPLETLDLRFGVRSPALRRWVRQWDIGALRAGSKLEVPALLFCGWWDGTSTAAAHMDGNRLVVGTWASQLEAPDRSDLSDPDAEALERAAGRDQLNDEFDWFDRHLMDLTSIAPAATVFVTGANEWRDFDDWPPATEPRELFLTAEHGLTASAVGGGTAEYVVDPDDPLPFGRDFGGPAPFDRSEMHASREDLLIFDTDVVDEPFVLAGAVRAELDVSCNAPDFDLCLALYDVHPDGRMIFLSDGVLRARFRDQKQAAGSNGTSRYEITFSDLGHLVETGHRLRLEVASAALGRWDVNPNTGGDLATEVDARSARITIHCGSSRLLLPVAGEG
jgi:putative CocE/NonD family hydrolase